jgi:hypothetical protein
MRLAKMLLALTLVLTMVLSANGLARAVSTTVVIGEFRTRGPSGGNDEFVELYNLSAVPVNIGGWKLNGSNNAGTVSTRVTISAGVTLQPYQHYLLANTGANGYSGSTPYNQSYSSGITDDGGLALLDASNVIIDQVGMSTGSAYKEGTIITPTTSNNNQSYARLPDTLSNAGGHKNGVDTDNNIADFIYNSGTSSPENLSSPTAVTTRALNAVNAPTTATWIVGLGGAIGTGTLLIMARRVARRRTRQ